MKKCRVGLVGLGHVAQVCHLPGYAGAKNIEVVAGAEVREDILKKVAGEWGFKGYTEYEKMLREEHLDIVCITTGPRFTPGLTAKAAEHGVHVLVEKPMALTLAEARSMIDTCRARGVKLFYGETYRFLPVCRTAREMIAQGRLGDLFLLLETVLGGEGRDRFQSYQIYNPGDPGATFMGLMDHGIHLVDLFRWMTGSEVDWVFGRGMRAGQQPCTEFLTMQSDREAIGQLLYNEVSFPSDLPQEGIFSWGAYSAQGKSSWESHPANFRIHGSKGALRLFPYPNRLFFIHGGGVEEIRVPDIPHPRHFGLQIDSFAASVLNDTEPEITGEDGLRALEVILAAYDSYETKKIIPLRESRLPH
jgi:predicted dehydrogenase